MTSLDGIYDFVHSFNSPERSLRFIFTYFQRQCTTQPRIQELSGFEPKPNGWWLPSSRMVRQLEICMDARLHCRFISEEYVNAHQLLRDTMRPGGPILSRDTVMANPALCILVVKKCIREGDQARD